MDNRNRTFLASQATVALPTRSPEEPIVGASVRAVIALWTAYPVLTVMAASGLLLTALANYASLAAEPYGEPMFWAGLLLIVVPFAARIVSKAPSRNERIVLVLGLGLALYLVKIVHSPSAFTFPDEFVHLRNLNEILDTNHLFSTNGALPATPYYPGLEIVASALVSLGGMSTMYAGVILIGVARLMILLALFFLYERVSGSAQVAGIGALLYMANPNYLFWSAQFSYESLALPMAVVLLLVVLWRERVNHRIIGNGLKWTTFLILFATVVTHHLTAYVLVAVLWALVVLYRLSRIKSNGALGTTAVIATLVTIGWLVVVATPTVLYLVPVFRDALAGLVQYFGDPGTGRELFQSNTGVVAPLWERAVAIGSVLATLALLLPGLVQIKRDYWKNPFVLLMGGAAILYPALLVLRLTRTSWEISNRASEFLYIGVAFVVALALVKFHLLERGFWHARLARASRWIEVARSPYVVAPLATLLFLGGVIAGWPPNGRLAQPLGVKVDDVTLYPQGYAAATWMRTYFEKNTRLATDYGNGRLMVSYGNQYPLTGNARGIIAMLGSHKVDSGVKDVLTRNRLQYVVVDRRVVRDDPLVGTFFTRNADLAVNGRKYFSPEVYGKFDREPHVDLVFDSGNIMIYRVEAIDGFSPTE